MADRQAFLKTVKWSLVVALGLQVVFVLLLFGRPPLLLRWFIYPQAQSSRQGMRLAVYNTIVTVRGPDKSNGLPAPLPGWKIRIPPWRPMGSGR